MISNYVGLMLHKILNSYWKKFMLTLMHWRSSLSEITENHKNFSTGNFNYQLSQMLLRRLFETHKPSWINCFSALNQKED